MAILPSTQDVTQFLGSSVGKPVDFNPAQQTQMPGSGQPMQMPHPQQNMSVQPSPYMPSGGPYNPYMSKWAQLMNSSPTGGVTSGPTMPSPNMPQPPIMHMPGPGMGMPTGGQMSGITSPMSQGAGGGVPMMRGMFQGPMR